MILTIGTAKSYEVARPPRQFNQVDFIPDMWYPAGMGARDPEPAMVQQGEAELPDLLRERELAAAQAEVVSTARMVVMASKSEDISALQALLGSLTAAVGRLEEAEAAS